VNAFVRRCAEAALAACLGVVGGLSVSWLRPHGSRTSPKDPPLEPTPAPETPVPSEQGAEALAVLRSPELGRRASPAAPSSSAPVQSASSPPTLELPDLDEQMREADRFHEEQHEAALRRHGNEPRDARWASATERRLEADLEGVASSAKFKVVRVDCRTTTCVGILEWHSYQEAMRGYGATMRRAFSVNCAQEVLLLPPLDAAAPYQASMIFDCESWRAAGN
jgi:hypothetical protein